MSGLRATLLALPFASVLGFVYFYMAPYKVLMSSMAPFPGPEPFIHASPYETLLQLTPHTKASMTIVVGPHGCGKSSLVSQALSGQNGVVSLRLEKENSVLRSILRKYRSDDPKEPAEDLVMNLFRDTVLRQSCPLMPSWYNRCVDRVVEWWTGSPKAPWLPVIVIEAHQIRDAVPVVAAYKELKELVDKRVASVIMVLSDLPSDHSRYVIRCLPDNLDVFTDKQ